MIPVLLSGGSGTRLWPVSRSHFPKQFCELFEETLQTKTIQRLLHFSHPWIVTSLQLKNLTEGQLKKLNLSSEQIIYEPSGKNTAPAIALLCHQLMARGLSQEVVGIFPSDHLIQKEDEFYKAVHFAEKIAAQNKIVTLGIKPTYPETGYGYIQMAQVPLLSEKNISAHSVQKFHEKPDFKKAKTFIESNFFCWNAGIFIFKVEVMARAFERLQPKLWKAFSGLKADSSNLAEVYGQVENISIDYAILEKLNEDELACVPADVGWSDVGSWDALFQVKESMDGSIAPQKKVSIESKKNHIHGVQNKTYTFIDVDDVSIVDTQDALLVFKNGSSQRVKEVVESLKGKSETLLKEHPFEFRPWGYYEILKNTEHFKSKVIQVSGNSQISYQSHDRREEHWVITRGKGEVVLDDQVIPVQAGTYVKIPLKAKHRIRNTQGEVLEFIEVQLGSYFGEDDIKRYQDDYQRT